jgi:uncharacterized membrane protein
MPVDSTALLTILGMALVTYATRVSGLWLMGGVTPSPRVRAWLSHLPGAILVSLVAPDALTKGPADLLATLVVVVVAARTRNLLLTILIGVGAAWALRLIF